MHYVIAADIYISCDGTRDFNRSKTNDQIKINKALKFVAGNPEYTTINLKGSFIYVVNNTILIGNNIILEGYSTAVIKLADYAGWVMMRPLIQQKSSSGNINITESGFEVNVNKADNKEIFYDFYDCVFCYP